MDNRCLLHLDRCTARVAHREIEAIERVRRCERKHRHLTARSKMFVADRIRREISGHRNSSPALSNRCAHVSTSQRKGTIGSSVGSPKRIVCGAIGRFEHDASPRRRERFRLLASPTRPTFRVWLVGRPGDVRATIEWQSSGISSIMDRGTCPLFDRRNARRRESIVR